ncbi:hypothetical protein SCHPADRAFT_519473 [Schizopora paradoxa]|uniref:Uncharacterized protein n=1 Tax=Schizopora paradoxa TaxID=27342 RepID=A0A0H2RF29_9AGAM|nr:hypothetical protein SCHPADRAFT_519473 [Schizopora paradoxa]
MARLNDEDDGIGESDRRTVYDASGRRWNPERVLQQVKREPASMAYISRAFKVRLPPSLSFSHRRRRMISPPTDCLTDECFDRRVLLTDDSTTSQRSTIDACHLPHSILPGPAISTPHQTAFIAKQARIFDSRRRHHRHHSSLPLPLRLGASPLRLRASPLSARP